MLSERCLTNERRGPFQSKECHSVVRRPLARIPSNHLSSLSVVNLYLFELDSEDGFVLK